MLKALRANGIKVVAIHHHMTGEPSVAVSPLLGEGRGGLNSRARSDRRFDQLGK